MAVVLVPFHLDEHLPELGDALPPGIDVVTVVPVLPGSGEWERYGALHEAVAQAVHAQAVSHERGASEAGACGPVAVVSGDCTVSLGTVAGIQRAGVDVGVVWLDAHGDVHTVESSTSGYPGGMPLRILSGHRPVRYPAPDGLTTVDEARLVLVDARDLDPAEREYLGSSRVRRVEVTELDDACLPEGPLVLHIDLDVVDSTEIAALRYPVTPGPSSSEVLAAARRVMDTGRVVALDLAATWNPTGGATPGAGAALLADLLGLVRGRAS